MKITVLDIPKDSDIMKRKKFINYILNKVNNKRCQWEIKTVGNKYGKHFRNEREKD